MKYADIQHTDFKVSDFLSWQRAGTLELSPSFQRRPVWAHGAKSFLIDTVVRGFPMPVIFLRSVLSDTVRYEPMREVVDGQQRIRTLISFIAPDLLKDLHPERDEFTVKRNHNRELAGKAFSQLDATIQQRILAYDFSVHVFPSDTDDREILQVFARMNATGVKLSPQELRNAEYFGEFKGLMYDLGAEQLARWRNWATGACSRSTTSLVWRKLSSLASSPCSCSMAFLSGRRRISTQPIGGTTNPFPTVRRSPGAFTL